MFGSAGPRMGRSTVALVPTRMICPRNSRSEGDLQDLDKAAACRTKLKSVVTTGESRRAVPSVPAKRLGKSTTDGEEANDHEVQISD